MPDFKSAFCERYGCPPAEFEEQAFRKCLYRHVRLLAPLLRAIRPSYFARDLSLIHYLGAATTRRNALAELAAFEEDTHMKWSFARNVLRIRVSARKAAQLVVVLLPKQSDSPSQ